MTLDPMKISVLDHGYVRLVEHMGSDLSIVRAARVSYDAAWRAGEDQGSDKRLINYLWRNKHTTPFEAVEFQFEVKCPIFVARQWHRHRTWSYNELSARYRELPEEFYLPNAEVIGVQSTDNKQARDITPDGLGHRRVMEREILRRQCEKSFETYRDLLSVGWPRELARSVLPLNTYTHFFAKVDLLNLMKFIGLRSDPHAQFEIRQYSDAMKELAKTVCPVAIEAFDMGGKNKMKAA